jgi:hypothetical protein
MLMRLLCGGIILFWTAATIWLIRHDVVPALTARDVPRFSTEGLSADGTHQAQARIEDKTGRRVGTVWSVHTASPAGMSRRDVFWIEQLGMLPLLRIEANSDFTAEGRLDTFNLKLFGADERIELEGEEFSGNLAFRLTVGRKEQLFKVDASAAGMIGDLFRPFPTLPQIELGQSWRMHVVNPLAAITGFGSKLIPMVVKVTGKERLPTPEGPVECFVVETDRGARAWVDARGHVLRQEVEAPIGGRLTIVAEPFDEDRLREISSVPLPSGEW